MFLEYFFLFYNRCVFETQKTTEWGKKMHWLIEGLTFLWDLIRLWWLEIIVCAVVIACVAIALPLLHTVFCRVVFVQKLKKICKEKNISYQVRRFPLLSLFSKHAQIDVLLSLEQKETALCFFPGITLKKNIYIQNKNCAFSTKPHTLLFWRSHSSGFSPSLTLDDESLKKTISMDIPQIEQRESVLIIHPTPIKLYTYQGNGYRVSGSGDRVDSLTIYEGADYIKFLSRTF